MAWIARDGSLISDRGAPGRVRFLTDVKNVTRMQSKLCQPVRFIISLLRVSTQGISLSREKFNSQSETTSLVCLRNSPFVVPFLSFLCRSLCLI